MIRALINVSGRSASLHSGRVTMLLSAGVDMGKVLAALAPFHARSLCRFLRIGALVMNGSGILFTVVIGVI